LLLRPLLAADTKGRRNQHRTIFIAWGGTSPGTR
jgi:hypothetical protein